MQQNQSLISVVVSLHEFMLNVFQKLITVVIFTQCYLNYYVQA